MNGPSEKQIAYAVALANRRMFADTDDTYRDYIEREHGMAVDRWVRTRTRRAASMLIDSMLLSRVKEGESTCDPNVGNVARDSERAPDPPEGVHATVSTPNGPGAVYRVQVGRQSGNLYATQMIPQAGQKPAFVYVGRRPFRELSNDTLLTFDQAVELSAQFGFCIRCGRKLTAEMSASLGIGPVCGKALHKQERDRRKSEKETAQ